MVISTLIFHKWHLFHSCSEARLSPIAPVLLSGMTKLIGEAKDVKLLNNM